MDLDFLDHRKHLDNLLAEAAEAFVAASQILALVVGCDSD